MRLAGSASIPATCSPCLEFLHAHKPVHLERDYIFTGDVTGAATVLQSDGVSLQVALIGTALGKAPSTLVALVRPLAGMRAPVRCQMSRDEELLVAVGALVGTDAFVHS